MSALNERVAKLEVSVETVAVRLESLEKRLWILGLLVVGASNGIDLMKIFVF